MVRDLETLLLTLKKQKDFMLVNCIRAIEPFVQQGVTGGVIGPVESLHFALDLPELNWKSSWSSIEVKLGWKDSKT